MLKNSDIKIIIVDDDAEFQEELQEMLTLSGYEVVVAEDGYDAIDKALVSRPAVMLLDLKMTPKSGFQLADELTNILRLKDVVIVAMTGFFKEKEHRNIMKMCGIRTCILKPIQPLDLIAKIEFVIEEEKAALGVAV